MAFTSGTRHVQPAAPAVVCVTGGGFMIAGATAYARRSQGSHGRPVVAFECWPPARRDRRGARAIYEKISRDGVATRESQLANPSILRYICAGDCVFDATHAGTYRIFAQVGDVGRFVDMKAVGKARGERGVVSHRPRKAAEPCRRRRQRVVIGACAPPSDRLTQQEFVERRGAYRRADVTVGMQIPRVFSLPADVLARELVGRAGAMQKIRLLHADERMHATQ